jgi:hypothetical protein
MSAPALAYDTYADECGGEAPTWTSGGVTMAVSTYSFPSVADRNDIEDGIDVWDDQYIPGSDFNATHSVTAVTTTRNNDGINIVAMAEITEYGCAGWPGPIAITEINLGGCGLFGGDAHLDETDILLNCSYDWSRSESWYEDVHGMGWFPYPWDMEMIVAHEMGHAAGLDDLYSPGFSATMEGRIAGGSAIGDDGYLDSSQFTASENDHQGIRHLYPDGSNNGDDLAVQSFIYWDDGDRYERYCLGDATRPSPFNDLAAKAVEEGLDPEDCPSLIPDGPEEPLDIYELAYVDVAFQLLNQGDVTRSTDLRFYLASDATNPATWVTMHTRGPTVGPNTPYLIEERLQIPEGTGTGTYYIVAEVDPDDVYGEVREDNNVAVWKRELHVTALADCGCHGAGVGPSGLLLLTGLVLRRRRREAVRLEAVRP